MQDPSTPNPSDPRNSGSDQENPPKKPLKLKPIGQPKPEPEPSESKNESSQEEANERPAPKAVPTDPAPAAESRLDERRKNLKLRRMIIKDVEINPHINPDAEPVPEAQPFEEPEEAPPPPDLKAVMEAPKTEEAPATPPPSSVETPPVEETEAPGQENHEDVPGDSDKEKTPPDKAEQSGPSEKPKLSPVRKIIAGCAFLGVFCLAALLGIAYFNPFGKDLAPIQPSRIPIVPGNAKDDSSQIPEEPEPSLASVPKETTQPDLQAYLHRLQTHRLIPSDSPKGVFVDSVFVPEGAILDPRTGLTLSAVSDSGDGAALILTPGDGPSISIPLNRGK